MCNALSTAPLKNSKTVFDESFDFGVRMGEEVADQKSSISYYLFLPQRKHSWTQQRPHIVQQIHTNKEGHL